MQQNFCVTQLAHDLMTLLENSSLIPLTIHIYRQNFDKYGDVHIILTKVLYYTLHILFYKKGLENKLMLENFTFFKDLSKKPFFMVD